MKDPFVEIWIAWRARVQLLYCYGELGMEDSCKVSDGASLIGDGTGTELCHVTSTS